MVGWAGRLTAIKRPLDLVRTLRALVDRDVDALLVLVGDGEDRGAVEALAAELGVADRCRLVGFQQSIRAWYAAFDATLLTSANEGTPVVAIESLAAARPVVATRAGGTGAVVRRRRERVTSSRSATRRVGREAGELAARSRAPRRRMGARGAEDVRARFAIGRMADEIEAVYRTAARAMKVLHLHKLTGVSGSEGHLLALLPALRERGIDARFLGLDVPGSDAPRFYERPRRPRRPVPPRPLRDRRQPADGARRDPGRPGERPTSCTRTSSTPTSTARVAAGALRLPDVSTRHNDDRYLLGPFRYVDRAFARVGATSDRDLRRRPPLPRGRGPRTGEAA